MAKYKEEKKAKGKADDPKDKDDKKSEDKGKEGGSDRPPMQAQGHHMMNDMAYHLHHPQIKGGPQGAKMPPSKPKC